MKRDPQVVAQIEQIDALLQSSGVRDMCNACWAGKLINRDAYKTGYRRTWCVGCCNGPRCELLSETGCTAKPLNCALWLCDAARRCFPEVAKQLDAIKDQWPPELADPYVNFRKKSLDFELSQLKRASNQTAL